ncbi:MAG: DUF2231 domain-containing protein [Caldilineaceae bacterium]
MESRIKVLGHPLHPMLIVLPLGLLSMAVIFDIVQLLTRNNSFSIAAYWNIAAGVLTGLLAAAAGLRDWLAIPGGTRAKTVGALHGLGNLIVVVLFGVSWWMRRDSVDFVPDTLAFFLGLVAFAIAGFAGWLGGELVYRLRVAVDDGANLDVPNSLSKKPATTLSATPETDPVARR